MHICFYRAETKQHCLLYLTDKTSNPKPCFEISEDPTCLWFHVEIRHTLGKPGAKKSPGRHQSPKWRWKHLNTWRRGRSVLYAASKNSLGIFSLGPPFLLWHTPHLCSCAHTHILIAPHREASEQMGERARTFCRGKSLLLSVTILVICIFTVFMDLFISGHRQGDVEACEHWNQKG